VTVFKPDQPEACHVWKVTSRQVMLTLHLRQQRQPQPEQ
jgi:hypothetical protein